MRILPQLLRPRTVKVFLIGLLLPIALQASDFLELANLRFETFDSSDGLSTSSITQILQDDQGFLWIGTNNGLNRFDGRDFPTFFRRDNDPASIVSDAVVSLFKDSKSRLWIGTSEGISRYLPASRSFKNYVPNPTVDPNPVSNRVTAFCEFPNGGLIAATQQGTLHRYDPLGDSFEQLVGIQIPDIRSLLGLPDGRLLVGANGQIALLDLETGRTANFPLPRIQDDRSAYQYAEDFEPIGTKVILIATSHAGILSFDRESETFSQYPFAPDELWVNDLTLTEQGAIIATSTQGLFVSHPETGAIAEYQFDLSNPYSIASRATRCSTIDRQSNLWVGTERGLCKATAHKAFSHYGPKPSPTTSISDTSASALFTDSQDRLWIGYFSGQLDILDRANGERLLSFPYQTDNPRGPGQGTIHFIKATRDGTIWTGSFEGGLRRYDPLRNEFENVLPSPYSDIRDIAEDGSGQLWAIAHGQGLIRYDRANGSLKLYQNDPSKGDNTLIDNWATCIVRDHAGVLWMGSGTGLCRFDPIQERFRNYRPRSRDPSSLSRVPVYDLHVDEDGTLWVGTLDGINKYDTRTDSFRAYKTANDPALSIGDSTSVRSIEHAATGEIWFSTDRGLMRLDTDTWTGKSYGAHDGLRSSDFLTRSSHRDKAGRLYFGGINGVTTFFPNQIIDSAFSPAPIITKLSNLKEPDWQLPTPPHLVDTPVSFPHQTDSFAFEFVTLNFNRPDSLSYSYQLAGFDPDWSRPSANASATYTNLPPGDYTFKVKAANSDGIWSEGHAAFSFTITPPFWSTAWFRFSSILLAASLLSAIHRLRVRNIRIQNEKLEKTVAARTNQLARANEELAAQREEIQCQNEELIANKADLELRVDQRTRDLKVALAEARRADQLKSSFLENMSHEIRTPMNAIIGFLSILQEREHSEEEKQAFFKIINSSSDSLLTLIDDILDLSTLESGTATIRPESVPLDALFAELESAHRTILRSSGKIDLQIDYEKPSSPFEQDAVAQLDPTRIRQILNNLLSNATKFTDKGVIRFGYGIATSPNGDSMIHAYVSDTGIGISQEDQANIFERFRKVESDKSRLYRGTGLGLAITRNLVELMNGEIRVSSTLGQGSSFSFTLPYLPSGSSMEKAAERTNANRRDQADLKILVAEDEDPNFEYISEALSSCASVVDRASNGAEAVDFAQSRSYDLILMDLNMPEMDGLQATREIRRNGVQSPILVQTAHIQPSARRDCIDAGADLVLRKPFSPLELREAIGNALKKATLARNPPRSSDSPS
ncbi:two-component regulator propeller domain-containing protein [Pelagicoccus sp. SDUM812003]|uniref:two-component regulator propeller domain-containing protein n=1 Tax=Pelagicoccus sp. SDUM812003 TaxID=3041267 RepID=UPI0028101B7B|nr:two-component regulator propeller domain-containing protein [Pelagicoccus sp. SDUM812003]MDQ8205049.1 two-component regulator propeller domain-containing protein [Pelagicoccus sp. SDUM812003]